MRLTRCPRRENGVPAVFLLTNELDKPDLPVKIFDMKPQYVEVRCRELECRVLRLQILGGKERFVFLNPASNDREVAYGLV